MRTIDADALKKKICREYHPMDEIPFFEILHIISNAPTIEERPTGEWKNYDGEIYCSNCGVECAYDETGEYILGRFCCNCGAKMRRGEI